MDALRLLTPPRRQGVEYLDAPEVDERLRCRSLRDVALSNALFGGTSAVLAELRPVLDETGPRATLLDVGTGLGDIPHAAAHAARRHGVDLLTIGIDRAEALASASRARTTATACADALRLPLRDQSVDVVTCSQVLHHFLPADAVQLLRELHRVARRRVIVSDIRRSWLAAAGLWVASFPLGFHPVSRHDGVVSVLRGFTPPELTALVQRAVGQTPRVRRRLGFRVTASWRPHREEGAR